MVLTPSKVGIEHLSYYTLTAEAEKRARAKAGVNGAAAYYASDAPIGPGTWLRSANLNVDQGSEISVDQLRNYLACLDPATGEALGRPYKAGGTYTDALGVTRTRRTLSAYDLTLSIPKSISAAWALAPPELRAEIEAAVMDGIQAAVTYIESHAVVSRRGAGGTERVAVPGGVPIACYLHTTSRAGDPQIHAHLLAQNRVLCEDDKWRTLDGKAIYDHLYPASLLSAAVTRTSLSLRLGWAWREVDQRGHADLSGVPQELLDHWSKRHAEVAKAAADMIREHEQRTGAEPTPHQRELIWDKAAVLTRDAKQLGHEQDDHQRWADDAAQAGFDPADVLAALDAAVVPEHERYGRPQALITDPRDPSAALTTPLAAAIAASAETSRSQLTDAHIDAAAAAAINAHPSLVAHRHDADAAAVVAAAHARIAESIRSVLIGTPSEDHAAYETRRWHSAGLIAAETAVAQWFAAEAIEPAEGVDALDTTGLSADQAEAAALLCSATTNGLTLVGPAGSGKTTTLARVAAAIGHDRTFAVCPTAVAAGTLSDAIGADAETVAKALDSPDLLPRGGLLIIDEAGQVSTRDFAALCGHAASRGMRVAAVGDHAQQAAITAGGMFSALTDHDAIPTVALLTLHRFNDEAEAAATVRLRRGEPDSLDYHRRNERVTHSPAAHTAEHAAQWWEHRRDRTTVISAPSMELVHAVNAAIAARRAELGETGDAIAVAAVQPVRLGEIIITRRNARKITTNSGRWIRNGDRWTVTGSDGRNGVTVAAHDQPDETAVIPASYLRRWTQLGYCTTHTRAQSVTVDEALAVVDNSTRLPSAYVGLTRGRDANWLHAITDIESHDPDAPTEHLDLEAVLAGLLERRDQPAIASDLDAAPEHVAPALHLHDIALTPTDRPLPVPAGYDAAKAISGGEPAARSQWQYETQLQSDWQEWLDTMDLLGHPDDELHADPAFAWADPDAFEPTPDEVAEFARHPHIAAPGPLEPSYPDDLDPPWADPDGFEPTPDEVAEFADLDPAHPTNDHYDEQDTHMPAATATARPQAPRVGVDIAAIHREIAARGLAEWMANRYGVKLGPPADTERRVECPQHRPGKAGTAAIYRHGDRHTMHCFRCNITLDAIDMLVEIEGMTKGDAIRSLAAELGVTGTAHYIAPPVVPRVDIRTRLRPQDALPPPADHTHREAAGLVTAALSRLDTPTSPLSPTPAWAAAILAYEASAAAGDAITARAAAARIGGLADPTARDQLIDAGVRPQTGTDIDAARRQIVHARWQAHGEDLTELTRIRRSHHHRDPQTAPADEHAWASAVQHWLHDPAAISLTATWTQLASHPPTPADAPPDAHLTLETVAAALQPAPSGHLPLDPLPHPTPGPTISLTPQPAPPQHQAQLDALERAAAWYHRRLLDSPAAAPAREYLLHRGITPDQWQQHRIGWAPQDWRAATDVAGDDDVAYRSGIANRKRGRTYDFLRNRIVFPITDPAGRTIAFAGRALPPDDDPKYLNTRNTDIYAKRAALYGLDQAAPHIAATATAVIVEGYTDVLACRRAGITNVVAACGTAITADHIDTLRDVGCERIIGLLDADEAGQQAAAKLTATGARCGLSVAAAYLPAGCDPDDTDPHTLHRVLDAAQPATLNTLIAALEDHNPADAAPTQEALHAALEAIDTHDDITAAVAAQTLAAALGPNWRTLAGDRLERIDHHSVTLSV